MFASYSLLSIIGMFHPLKMLPIVLFMIIYKSFGSSLSPTHCGQQTNWRVRPPKGWPRSLPLGRGGDCRHALEIRPR